MLNDPMHCSSISEISVELRWSIERRRQNEATEAPELLYQFNSAPCPFHLTPDSDSMMVKLTKWRNLGIQLMYVCLWNTSIWVWVFVCDACILHAENNLMYWTIKLYFFKIFLNNHQVGIDVIKWDIVNYMSQIPKPRFLGIATNLTMQLII